MRSRKAFYNTASYYIYICVDLLCAFILPHLIITNYGSANNGILASITQFLSCTELLYMGIAGVTRAALYRPLSNNDINAVSGIMNATIQFMRKVANAYLVILVLFSLIYPYFVRDEYSFVFTSSLVLIIGLEKFFQYFFATANRILLVADQSNYIVTLISLIVMVLSNICAVVLIRMQLPIHVIKLVMTLIQIINPLLTFFYVRKKYKLKRYIQPDTHALKQRWDACAISLANFFYKNTDIVLITILLNIREVSVYSVYYMVINGINKIGAGLSSGIEGAFGSLLVENQDGLIKKDFAAFETVIFTTATIVYSCSIILIVPFVKLYTKGIYDINYIRTWFGFWACLGGFFATLRIPYQALVQAAGKYKETRNGAFLEAIVNIVFSLALIHRYGIAGITFATVCAMVIRSTQYAFFAYHSILKIPYEKLFKRMLISILDMLFIMIVNSNLNFQINSYTQWFVFGFFLFISVAFVSCISAFVFFREDCKTIINVARRALHV